MPTVHELSSYLDGLFPPATACLGDPVGLCLGPCDMEVTGITLAVDVTCAAIEAAVASGHNFLFAHHPPLYRAVTTLTHPSVTVLLYAAAKGIAVYAAHTNLDAHATLGTNPALAAWFSGQIVGSLEPTDDGLLRGSIARVDLSREDFLARLNQYSPNVLTDGLPDRLHTIALWPGAGCGDDQLAAALAQGCQALVLGDADLHLWRHARDNGMGLVAAGHYHTEFGALALVQKALQKAGIGVYCLDVFEDEPYTRQG